MPYNACLGTNPNTLSASWLDPMRNVTVHKYRMRFNRPQLTPLLRPLFCGKKHSKDPLFPSLPCLTNQREFHLSISIQESSIDEIQVRDNRKDIWEHHGRSLWWWGSVSTFVVDIFLTLYPNYQTRYSSFCHLCRSWNCTLSETKATKTEAGSSRVRARDTGGTI